MNTNVPISREALAAMRTLVEAGVSDEAIGRALRELLLGADGDRLAQRRVATWTESAAPGGIDATGTPAVHSDAELATVPSIGSPPLAGMVPLKVRFATGKPSNVSIPAQLLQRVAIKLGSEDAARQRVRDCAKTIAENASNRSGLIQAALTEWVNT